MFKKNFTEENNISFGLGHSAMPVDRDFAMT